MKQFIIILLTILLPLMTKAAKYGWFEVEGRRVDLNYAYVDVANCSLDYVPVYYSDKEIAPYISNEALTGSIVFSGLLVEYDLSCHQTDFECLNEFEFIISGTVEMLKMGTEIEDIKNIQPDFLWGGEIDFDNKNFVYTKNELSASGKSCPCELWYRGRTEVNTTTRVSFSLKGFPSNWKR